MLPIGIKIKEKNTQDAKNCKITIKILKIIELIKTSIKPISDVNPDNPER